MARREALITMGRIGVKVWIFKKELFKKTREDLIEEAKLVPKEELEELAKKADTTPPAEEFIPGSYGECRSRRRDSA